MEINGVFEILYPLVPIVAMFGFLPQFISLIRSKTNVQSVSLLTWFIWTGTWFLSLGYGYFCLQDLMFCLTCGINILCHLAIIKLILIKRYGWLFSRKIVSAPFLTETH